MQRTGAIVEATAVKSGDDELVLVDGLDEIGLLFVGERFQARGVDGAVGEG